MYFPFQILTCSDHNIAAVRTFKSQIIGKTRQSCMVNSRFKRVHSWQNRIKCHFAFHAFFLAVPLHAMEALGGRGGIAPTHS
jgi:hypothetical protein